MSRQSSKSHATGYPEFAVRRELISSYFSPPLARSTFYDLVQKGKIVPMKGLRGFYCLNDSLKRLGLREVTSLPQSTRRSEMDGDGVIDASAKSAKITTREVALPDVGFTKGLQSAVGLRVVKAAVE